MVRKRGKPTFLLRADVTTDDTTQVQDSLDVSAFVNVPEGEVLLIKRAWINYCNSNDGHAIVGSASAANTSPAISACATTRVFDVMQPSSEPSMIVKGYVHWANDGEQDLQFYHETKQLEPGQFEDGFYCAGDSISLTVDCSTNLSTEVTASFIFECMQIKMSKDEALAKAVSLTQ